MGRYYNGDIEGKFWVAVQASDDASFFGGQINEPNYIDYSFDKDEHLSGVEEGLKKCREKLGANKKLLDEFFEKNNGYNDDMLIEAYGWSEKETKENLEWYARLELGEKIFKYLDENGECSFSAEC